VSGNQRKQLEDLILDDSFIRYVNGVANKEECIYWQDWQLKKPERKVLVSHAKELMEFNKYDVERVPDPQMELKEFERSVKKNSIFERKRDGRSRYRSSKNDRHFWLITAASFLLVVLTLGVFQYLDIGLEENISNTVEVSPTTTSEYETVFGEKATLQLSDGSQIILNANSHLSYTWSGSKTNAQEINIHLQGEAWFDVKPSTGSTSRLFRVHTQDGIIEVTGTKFAVRTSPNGSHAVLKEGEIRILPKISSGQKKIATFIQPGEMARFFSNQDQIDIEKVNPELYTSWVRDVWIFDQTPLYEIGARMEMIFGVEVNINPTTLRNKTLSGTIGSTNLQLIKEGLSEALHVQVRQFENKVIIGPE
jgi:ferric-dicitrate binding protein FerR (iron transport regulator)